MKDADFLAGFLLLPPCAILEILSRKLWLLLALRLLLRSRIVVRLICSKPSFRLCRIGFASDFVLISFRCSSFSCPLEDAGFGGATRGSVARWSKALLQSGSESACIVFALSTSYAVLHSHLRNGR